jgi:hypothetical protein
MPNKVLADLRRRLDPLALVRAKIALFCQRSPPCKRVAASRLPS